MLAPDGPAPRDAGTHPARSRTRGLDTPTRLTVFADCFRRNAVTVAIRRSGRPLEASGVVHRIDVDRRARHR